MSRLDNHIKRVERDIAANKSPWAIERLDILWKRLQARKKRLVERGPRLYKPSPRGREALILRQKKCRSKYRRTDVI